MLWYATYYYRVGRQHLHLRRRGAFFWALLCLVDTKAMYNYNESMKRITGYNAF